MVAQMPDREPISGTGNPSCVEVVLDIHIPFQCSFGIGARAEVVDLPTGILGPTSIAVSGEREVWIWFCRLAAAAFSFYPSRYANNLQETGH